MRLHLYTHKVVQISFCKWPLPERRCYFFVCHLCERLSSRRPLIQMPFVRSIILTRDSGNKMAQLLALNWHVSFHEFYPSSIVSSGQQWPPYQYIFAEIGKRKKIKNRNSEKKNFFWSRAVSLAAFQLIANSAHTPTLILVATLLVQCINKMLLVHLGHQLY